MKIIGAYTFFSSGKAMLKIITGTSFHIIIYSFFDNSHFWECPTKEFRLHELNNNCK